MCKSSKYPYNTSCRQRRCSDQSHVLKSGVVKYRGNHRIDGWTWHHSRVPLSHPKQCTDGVFRKNRHLTARAQRANLSTPRPLGAIPPIVNSFCAASECLSPSPAPSYGSPGSPPAALACAMPRQLPKPPALQRKRLPKPHQRHQKVSPRSQALLPPLHPGLALLRPRLPTRPLAG